MANANDIEEVALQLVREGMVEQVRISFTIKGDSSVSLTRANGSTISAASVDLFDCLAIIRQDLESDGWLLLCNGARRDVYPSPMQRQMARGRYAYLHMQPRTSNSPPHVDIFEPADLACVGTVAEQKETIRRWMQG
ncbi:hypothetical protein [Nonomuraea endophytica]|uniref:hypothetical protein n=1 Tax=Nonomuraea endophytica TaxID=714136 RepID=UPI0037C510BC